MTYHIFIANILVKFAAYYFHLFNTYLQPLLVDVSAMNQTKKQPQL